MLGTVFANMSYDGYVRQEIINKRAFQSSKTFTNMRRIVFVAIEAIATRMMTEQLEACIKRGGCVFEFDVGYTKQAGMDCNTGVGSSYRRPLQENY